MKPATLKTLSGTKNLAENVTFTPTTNGSLKMTDWESCDYCGSMKAEREKCDCERDPDRKLAEYLACRSGRYPDHIYKEIKKDDRE